MCSLDGLVHIHFAQVLLVKGLRKPSGQEVQVSVVFWLYT